MLTALTAGQFADALAEAMHVSPEPGQARAERAVNVRVLEQLHDALGGMSPRPGWPLRCAPRWAIPAAAGRSPQPNAPLL